MHISRVFYYTNKAGEFLRHEKGGNCKLESFVKRFEGDGTVAGGVADQKFSPSLGSGFRLFSFFFKQFSPQLK